MDVERVPLRVSHERRSLRLRGFDYSRPGVYFVTIRARDDGHPFGELIATHVRLSQYGRIVTACWLDIPKHFPHVTLDSHVVMPDHVHGIIVINKRADADNVGAQHAAPLQLPRRARLSQTALRGARDCGLDHGRPGVVGSDRSRVQVGCHEADQRASADTGQTGLAAQLLRPDYSRRRRATPGSPLYPLESQTMHRRKQTLARRVSETGQSPFSTPRMSRSS